MLKNILFLLSIFISKITLAIVPVDGVIANCQSYPSIKNSVVPSSFKTTNNLVKSDISGFYFAEGKEIRVFGRVMDSNCTPIGDAKIYIWQANSKGYIQYPHKDKKKIKWIDPNFVGTGITNSNNMGRFDFATIMPGSYNRTTPYINIRVEHPKLKTLYSKIYFPNQVGDRIIDVNSISNSKKSGQVSAIQLDKPNIYVIDITMHEALWYKGY